ncbi:MAG: hypothetical protein ABSA53_04480 [Streptosporangiaceae bacterium]|jgi:hypothetical protein
MTTPLKTPPLKTPPYTIACRSVTATITVLILLAVGFGLAGYGPGSGLHRLASPVTHALHLDRIQG